MSGMVADKLQELRETLTDLKDRVRLAIAGELARVVAQAVQDVVQSLVSGRPNHSNPRPPPDRRPAAGRWDDDEDDRWDRERESWANVRGDDEDDRVVHRSTPVPADGDPVSLPAMSTAVAAGVYAARWWLIRKGGLITAAGLGLGIGLLGLVGGSLARVAVAVLAAAADILSVTDALGDGATRLEHL